MATILSTSEYKTAVNISSSEYDAQLNALIPMVNDFIERYCNRVFGAVSRTEKNRGIVDHTGRMMFTVKNHPIVSISEITVRFYGTQIDIDIDTSLLDIFEEEGIAYYSSVLDLQSDIVIRQEYKNDFYYTITYSGGENEVPKALKLAAIQMVADNMKYLQDTVTVSGTQSTGALASVQIGDYKESYESGESAFDNTHDEKTGIILTQTVKDLLAPFKRTGISIG